MPRKSRDYQSILDDRCEGESIACLARRYRISPQALYNFRNRLRQQEQPEFLPVRIASFPSSSCFCLQFPNQLKLLIPADCDSQALTNVVKVIREVL